MTEKPRPVPNRTQLLPDRPGIPPMAELPVAERIRPAEIFAAYEAGEIDLICVLGPTASGKTRYAVQLARALNRLRGNGQPLDGRCAGAEILSGDSRQVYRGMDLGTGKDMEEYQEIPYHLIDIAEPGTRYDIYQFQQDFETAYQDIRSRGGIPILCGGSGLYIEAATCGYTLPQPTHPPWNPGAGPSVRWKSLCMKRNIPWCEAVSFPRKSIISARSCPAKTGSPGSTAGWTNGWRPGYRTKYAV